MTYAPRPAHSAIATTRPKFSETWTVRRKTVAAPPTVALRPYSMCWLDAMGAVKDAAIKAPAIPVFEEAFSAFARGTLIPTEFGTIAIEDLVPGMRVETVSGGLAPIRWIGSMSIAPDAQTRNDTSSGLYRVMADSFGFGRPAPDLMLGPNARYVMKSDALLGYLGTSEALAPASSLADGMNVIKISPIAAVQTFHIALDRHDVIRANGIELETYHPGANCTSRLPGDLRLRFLNLFPYLSELAAFGAMRHPRLSIGDLEQLNAV